MIVFLTECKFIALHTVNFVYDNLFINFKTNLIMKNLDLAACGLEEMSKEEMSKVNGGMTSCRTYDVVLGKNRYADMLLSRIATLPSDVWTIAAVGGAAAAVK